MIHEEDQTKQKKIKIKKIKRNTWPGLHNVFKHEILVSHLSQDASLGVISIRTIYIYCIALSTYAI